ncbi:E3 ubiquitin-protein ligase SIRP1-like isoform X2 [Pistacia vera]|uniref:E3 ubiquitin-protein ligase SIRP1-like isoform X2 n=1 Tax=Pistacia vera TaxID=55513 RepID=UPI0012635EDB|nr:E3 ubiquitin-protein ligase SIRP1-like isoform X2 [Pistacia vera]
MLSLLLSFSKRSTEKPTYILYPKEMGDATERVYWCHMCTQMVNPRMESEIKCPLCEGGFVEEMSSSIEDHPINNEMDVGSDRAFSLWAPILLRLMGASGSVPSRPRITGNNSQNEEADQEREFESSFRRRRRSNSVSFLRMLQDIRSGIASQSNDSENYRERNGSLLFVNPMNEEALIIRGHNAATSLGDYLIGPGLDLLLQHLLENDPNRYGTPPTHKEAIKALPTVAVDKNLQCAVCLEDFDIGNEAKEMPCKHKFHGGCILPWLELHSSCPVCRFQMPSVHLKIEGNRTGNREVSTVGNNDAQDIVRVGTGGERVGNGRRHWIPILWPFDGLFSLSGSQNAGSSSSAPSSAQLPGTASHRDEN